MKFHRQCKRNITRVLYIALSILLINSCVVVKAATADDLREIIGDRRVTDETLIQDMRSIVYKYKKSQYQKELIDRLHDMGDFGYEDKYNSLMEEKETAQNMLETSFKANEDVSIVITYMNNVINVLDQLGALKKEDTYILEGFDENDDEEAYSYAISVMDSINDIFDLGTIGQDLEPPIDGLILQRPFGEIMIPGKSIKKQTNKGIDLYAKQNIEADSRLEVVSQFNGKIDEIEKLNGNTYRISISHGKSIKTIYEELVDIQVKEGSTIKQYQLIGYAANDSLHFEILLNTIPINPLFLYGKKGEYAYETWYVSNPGMTFKKIDFSNIKESYSEKVIDKNAASSVKHDNSEGTVTVEGGYDIPQRQIVK